MPKEKVELNLPNADGVSYTTVHPITSTGAVIHDESSGATLDVKIQEFDTHKNNNDVHVTPEEKTSWNNKSDFSGNYDDLEGAPYVPKVINATNNTSIVDAASADAVRQVMERADAAFLSGNNVKNNLTSTLLSKDPSLSVTGDSNWSELMKGVSIVADGGNVFPVTDKDGINIESTLRNSGGVDNNVVVISPDGRYALVATNASTSNSATIRKWNFANRFNNELYPDIKVAGGSRGGAFSPNSDYLAVAHISSPYITIYKRDGDTFTKLANPSVMPPGQSLACTFSPDGVHLVVASMTSPYLTIYKRDGDTFTKLANPSVMPPGLVSDCKYTPDGSLLMVAHANSPYLTVYKREGDTYSVTAALSGDPLTNTINKMAFSPDDVYLTILTNASILIYKKAQFGYSQLKNAIADPSIAAGLDCSYSYDNKYMAVTRLNDLPSLLIYTRYGDTFKLNELSLVYDNALSVAFSPITSELVVGGKVGGGGTFISYKFKRKVVSPDSATYTVSDGPVELNKLYMQAPTKNAYVRQVSFPLTDIDPVFSEYAAARNVSFSADGKYAVVSIVVAPYFRVYEVMPDETFRVLPNPAVPVGTIPRSCSISSDGKYIAVALEDSPLLAIYRRDGDTLVKLADPSEGPPAGATICYGTSFSTDGKFLVVRYNAAPFINIYSIVGDVFTKLATPSVPPPSSSNGAVISPDGSYMIVSCTTEPYLMFYIISGNTFNKIDLPGTVMPDSPITSLVVSKDGQYYAMTCHSTKSLMVYKKTATGLTKLPDPDIDEGRLSATSCTISPDNKYIVVTFNDAPYAVRYILDNDTITRERNINSAMTPTRFGEFSKDGKYLALAYLGTNTMRSVNMLTHNFVTLPNTIRKFNISEDYSKILIPKPDTIDNNTVEAQTIWEGGINQ